MAQTKKYRYNRAFSCPDCRKTSKVAVDVDAMKHTRVCPYCGSTAYNLGRKFKPPKQSDDKAWAVVAYLIEHGFWFQSIYAKGSGWYTGGSYRDSDKVPYPTTLKEAEVFVEDYKDQALNVE